MRPSKWLVFIRPSLAGFDRPLTTIYSCLGNTARDITHYRSSRINHGGCQEKTKMNYFAIEHPPENAEEYVKVPPNDIREEFIRSVADLVNKDNPMICTDVIPLEWAVLAYQSTRLKNRYFVLIVRAPVNFGETGDAHGYFYFLKMNSDSN
jgi:hypothetical protein